MYLSWRAARIKKRGITGPCLRTGKMGKSDSLSLILTGLHATAL
jgi:hypothetical protein